MISVKPKKNLGQHFLKDSAIASRIADTLDAFSPLPILEVGPGTGMLTQFLLSKERALTVVEIDRESVAYLKEHFPSLDGNILQQNFLTLDLSAHCDGPLCVIGNY